MKRVIIYIDGFNFYYALLKNANGRKWLNLFALFENMFSNEYDICEIKFFTALVGGNRKKQNQQKYLEALATIPKISVHYGYLKHKKCPFKNMPYHEIPEEKQTDVNIAVEMVKDAYENKYDICFLVSNDTDLISAMQTVKQQNKILGIAEYEQSFIAPKIKQHIDFKKTIKKKDIINAQFSDKIPNTHITKPKDW